MSKSEFLSKLKSLLSYELPGNLVEENLDYYRGYIEEEIKKGRSESEVLDELGNPQLISRTIIDAAKSGVDGIPGNSDDVDYQRQIYGNSDPNTEYHKGSGKSGQSGNHETVGKNSDRQDEGRWQSEGTDAGGNWYFYNGGCLGAFVVMMIIFFLFSLIGNIIGFLGPVLIPVCVVFLIIWLLSRRQ